jgi:hypothetical protein
MTSTLRYASRPLFVLALGLVFAFAALAAAAFISNVARGATTPVVIQAVNVDLTAGTLTITGTGFDTKQDTEVILGGAPIVIQTEQATQIVAQLPAGIQSGGYLLEVIITGGSSRQDEFDLVITNEDALEARVAALETLLAGVTRGVDPISNADTLLLTGMNLQVVNGSGSTNSENRVGNVIIGYNLDSTANPSSSDKRGSHNLVIGDGHKYTQSSGIVSGHDSYLNNDYSVILGGYGHLVDGASAGVIGGHDSLNQGDFAVIVGGTFNAVDGTSSFVGGGTENSAVQQNSAVVGGSNNEADGLSSFVAGGQNQLTTKQDGAIVGGIVIN